MTEQQFAEYVKRAEADLQHWKARAEAAEKALSELREQQSGTAKDHYFEVDNLKARAEAARDDLIERLNNLDAWQRKLVDRAEAAEKEVKRWKDAAKNLALSAETERDAAIFDRAVASGKVKLAEARVEAAEKERDKLREALERRGEILFGRDGD